jgi:hypothetical protein
MEAMTRPRFQVTTSQVLVAAGLAMSALLCFFRAVWMADTNEMSAVELDQVCQDATAGVFFLSAAAGMLAGHPFRGAAIGLAIAMVFNMAVMILR